MKFLPKLMAVAFAALLAGCGGGSNEQLHEVLPRADAAVRLNALPGFTTVNKFSENIVSYQITKTSAGYNVTDRNGAAAPTAIAGVALLQFADTSVILGDSDGNAGKAYRLYQAAFARTPDLSGLSFWIDHLNNAMSLAEVSSYFQDSAEFKSLYGTGISNTALVTLLYQNVLRRLPDSGGLAFWVDALSQGKLTQQAVLMYFSESAENKSLVAPAIQNGIAYLPSTVDAPGNLALTNVNPQTVASNSIASSTKLQATWKKAAGYTADHFLVTASETIGSSALSFSVPSTETTVTLTGLKSATPYSVVVSACLDAACARSEPSVAAEGRTPSEYWQLQGTGNTTAGLSRIVSDGNVRISATLFGPEAGGVTANRIQLYYGPSLVSGRQTLSTALTASATNAALASSYLSFVSSGATTGLLTPTPAATLIETIATGQGVPLSAAMGGKVRLFFEAQGIDRKTRIFTIDSVDGYVGQDFNTGSATVCSTTADYSSGGGCAIKVAIGLEGDSVAPNSKIINARQNKVGYPTLTDWRWDGAPGTFMVFTSGSISGCSTASRTHGYAVWDGSKWNVQYDTAGCPKLFANVQAAFPMHLGGVKYKLYYGDPSITAGKSSSSLPFLGPKKVIYADGARSGLTDRVDFEDWESQSNARGVIFLWPNGTELDSTAEGYIDDFHFLSPTGSLDLQVMYLAITNGSEVPLAASAVLINP